MKVRLHAATLTALIVTTVATSSAFAGTPAALSDADTSAIFGAANLSTMQEIGGSAKLGATAAVVGADALRGATGNIGVNVSVGALNAQANQIALVTTPQAGIVAQQNINAVAHVTGSGSAGLGAGALAGISGNIGVNIASGAANAQYNGLIVH